VIGHGAHAHGILIIDKPAGPTSHDIVASIRRALGTRAVGHAGTLDPAATGVLVLALGEGTKLISYLQSQTKRYDATIRLGASTKTCDAQGEIVASAPIPDGLADALRAGAGPDLDRALDQERARQEQIPPQFSAIKQGGLPAYRLARRGEPVLLAPRAVRVLEMTLVQTTADSLRLSLHVSKGYYVRALARDLGDALRVPAHLAALRRTWSEPFSLEESTPLSATPADLMRAGRPVDEVARRLFTPCELTPDGARRARHGQPLTSAHFASPPPDGTSAWFDNHGCLVALGRVLEPERFGAIRVFGQLTSSSAT
jgi:tRNA pseudouridine55 synthase